jgi:hypothetical protein
VVGKENIKSEEAKGTEIKKKIAKRSRLKKSEGLNYVKMDLKGKYKDRYRGSLYMNK